MSWDPVMGTVPDIRQLAKEWAAAEVAAMLGGVLDNGNTLLAEMGDDWLEENLVGLLPESGFQQFESLVEDEMLRMFRELTNKSGNFKGIGQ